MFCHPERSCRFAKRTTTKSKDPEFVDTARMTQGILSNSIVRIPFFHYSQCERRGILDSVIASLREAVTALRMTRLFALIERPHTPALVRYHCRNRRNAAPRWLY